MSSKDKTPQPKMTILSVVIFYGIMGAGGLLWNVFHEEVNFMKPAENIKAALLSVMIGAVVAAAVIAAGNFLEKHVKALRDLSSRFEGILGEISLQQAAVFSFASAAGEELLFRAGMMPSFGLIATSLLFGFVHGMFQKPFVAWGIFATVMGFVLGLMTLYTGNIIAAVVCHFTINYFNFLELGEADEVK